MSEFSDFLAGKQLIPKDYSGQGDIFQVSFTEDGWGCATSVAKYYGKDVYAWKRSKATQKRIAALIRREEVILERKFYGSDPSLTESYFVRSFAVGGGGVTFIHPKLFVHFTRWVDEDFSIWADEVIFDLLSGKTKLAENQGFQQDLIESNRLALASKDAIIAVQVGTLASQEFVIQSLTEKLDSKSITITKEVITEVEKEVMPIKYNMVGAISFAEYYDIEPTDYVNRIFVAAGALTRLDKDYLVNPGYEHLLSNPINPYTNQVSTRRSVKYAIGSSGAITILKHKKVTLLPHYKVILEDLTPDEISTLPQGTLFMQINKSGHHHHQPTMAELANKVVDVLGDTTKGANEVAKMALSKLPSVSQPSAVESSEEPDKGDSELPSTSSLLSTNVVPIKAA